VPPWLGPRLKTCKALSKHAHVACKGSLGQLELTWHRLACVGSRPPLANDTDLQTSERLGADERRRTRTRADRAHGEKSSPVTNRKPSTVQ
jgi:hypothetical protein